jgi:hypothetical protein
MSAHQFGVYEKIRKEEADRESKARKRKQAAKNPEELYQISSTYRIFSRAACNFTFPSSIERPVPNVKGDKEISENEYTFILESRGTLTEKRIIHVGLLNIINSNGITF